ncbi:MAG: thioredoxin domain-containing protein [Candidatus Nanohaloarchaea archaeon]|nr:thioredoxin domain-containing protein [Candidatus Nanohaloarchaea archaeon]
MEEFKRDLGSSITFSLSAGQAALVFFLIGIFVGGFFMSTISNLGSAGAVAPKPSNQGSDNGNKPSDAGNKPSQDKIDPSKISLKGEPVLGQEDAPVTMVMYEDFECPFCKKFETNTVPKVVDNYVKSGEVKMVWKDLPLPERIHPWADEGAAAMECVYRQDESAFWKVKDKVFSNQNSISLQNVESKIKQFASEEEVSKSAVQSCLDNDNPMSEVDKDKKEARSVGAKGTPTVFINGKKIVGAQPYSVFKQVIESELKS